ncbi:hypothetical protein OG780_19290 [Streptomyces sp. NBC_00386]|uniref:hypothetical protein n=1 Tax=Streptomyces sp. NBC_00386 TaxID=2975734 RepID=UPI002E2507F7
MSSLLMWAHAHPTAVVGATVLLLVAVTLAARVVRKTTTRPPAAVLVAAIGALVCTAYSGDTSWGFARDRLGMTAVQERSVMFLAAELALFSCALMARQNLRTAGAPGTPGLLVWFITGVQVIPAYAESGIVGGTVRAVVGPVMAALLWHLAMGIELRHAKPGADSGSLPALLARELRERLLSRLGLAVRDRSAEQISRDRWTVKAVGLAAKLADTPPQGRGRARLSRRLSVAVGKAQAGASAEQRAKLLDLLAARRHAASLATIDLASPWEDAVEVTVEQIPEERKELPPARPPVVPPGVRLLPLTARPVINSGPPLYRWDHIRGRLVTNPEVVIPESVPWHWKDASTGTGLQSDDAPKVTAAVPVQAPREVVTQVIALTPGELLKRAQRLDRDRSSTAGRRVTIAQLQDEFGLSRREATDLRRQVVTPEGR